MYSVNKILYKKLLHGWKRNITIPMVITIVGSLAFIISWYDKNHLMKFFLLVVAAVFIGWIGFKPFAVGINFINRVITEIEISDEKISGRTTGFTLLLGLIRRKPLEFDLSKLSTDIYGVPAANDFNKEHFDRIYVIDGITDKYYLGEKLFDDFSGLKRNLETFVGHPLEEKN